MYPSSTAAERYADGAVHAGAFAASLVAGSMLLFALVDAGQGSAALIAACVIYVVAVLASLLVSGAYHLLPQHGWRKALRRWDHAAIYPVIAGTFGPLLLTAGTFSAHMILCIIWVLALVGIAFKLRGESVDSKYSLASYVGFGLFALAAFPDFQASLPSTALIAIVLGGIFYLVGTLFYRSKTLSFRYPIWHSFGQMGGASFFTAIWIALIK